LQKNAREALDIDLTNQIVVIDEAHSKSSLWSRLISDLIDTLLSIYSTNLTSTHLASALSQLGQYLSRFRNRLKPIHALKIKQTLAVLKGLTRLCDKFMQEVKSPDWKGKSKAEMMDGNTLMARVGGGSDQVNIMEMVSYLKESKLARKVSGFAENQAEVAMKNGMCISLLLMGLAEYQNPRVAVRQPQNTHQ
jgi:chromosome transmission fidelity protein 1